MLTPQDVKTKEFTKAVFGGYDMATVDEFLEELSSDYEALYKETAILKNKLKVLVEKVEEYRSTEDAMRMALLTAQKMSKDILDEANAKSQSLISDAENNARARIEQLKADVRNEELKLDEAKQRTAAYAEQAKEMLARQIEILEKIDEISFTEPSARPAAAPRRRAPVIPAVEELDEAPSVTPASSEDKIDETAKNIEDSLSRIFEEDIRSDKVELASGPERDTSSTTTRLPRLDDVDEPTSPHPKFDFSNLQFGANYDINDKKKR